MRDKIISIIRMCFRFLIIITPKNNKQVCIHSSNDYDDQVFALVNELRNRRDGYKIRILKNSNTIPPRWAIEKGRIVHCRKNSFRGVITYLLSKYIFFTTGCFSGGRPADNQVCINVWHGMPIKVIGQLDTKGPSSYFPRFHYSIATSKFYNDVMSKAFGVNNTNVLITGIPRNDLLFHENYDTLSTISFSNFSKIVIWLPTFRKAVHGAIRLDGVEPNDFFDLVDFDPVKFNYFLKKNNLLCLIKPHPLSADQLIEKYKNISFTNIKLITGKWLTENNTLLYSLLKQSDLLITDVSSVYIDYLLTDKPIIISFRDIEEYSRTRGTIFPFTQETIPGPRVTNLEELERELYDILISGNDRYRNARLKVKAKYHDIQKDFTKKLFEEISLGQNLP